MNDAEARRRIREELNTTFVVEAAAGTGKTTTLIDRIVATVAAGGQLDRMIAVTFTDKAAGELKLRLRERLEAARRQAATPELRERFVAALRALERVLLGTIHGLCGELLRERPVEAGVDPLFEVCSEEEAQRLVSRTFDAWFQRVLAQPPPGVARVLHLRGVGSDLGPRDKLRRALTDLIDHRDFPQLWSRPPFDREARLRDVLDAMRAVGELAELERDRTDYLRRSLEQFRRFAREADARLGTLAGRPLDDDARSQERARLIDRIEAELRAFATSRHRRWKGRGKRFGDRNRAEIVAQRDEVGELIDAFVRDAEQDLAPLLQRELLPAVEEYEKAKRQRGRLDFLDLLLRTRALLRDHDEVRAELQQRFTHIFVDEFQDTDPVQVEVLFLLAAADPSERDWRKVSLVPGKLFVVGDPKQAVYRFRRADLGVYEQAKQSVLRAGGEALELSTSFRAVPSVQRFINAAFAPRMGEGTPGEQPRYVALAPHRSEVTERPAVVALPIAHPYGTYGPKPYRTAVSSSTAEAAAAFVDWLVRESGWEVGREPRAVRFSDVAFLFTRMSSQWADIVGPYVRALASRDIPHVLFGGRSFYEREEIAALRQVMNAIEWPDDELAVYATLRGPFLGCDDATLLGFRKKVREHVDREQHSFHPFGDRDGLDFDEPEREVDGALRLLAKLHISRNRRPIADTLSAFLSAARVQAGLGFWPAPAQTLSNVSRFVDQARQVEARGATSFRAFIAWADEQAERGAGSDASVAGDERGGVRLMTVHKAKGLEFPVVVLCDPMAKETQRNPSRYVDSGRGLWAMPLCGAVPAEVRDHEEVVCRADEAERVRLAYVAGTRAEDLLVIPAVGDNPIEQSWLTSFYRTLYPANRIAAESAPGCPPFEGHETILSRNEAAERAQPTSVRAGLHRIGEVEVVWWDPAALKLEAARPTEMRREALLIEGPATEAGRRNYAAWRDTRARLLERASVPSRPLRSVTELAVQEAPRGLGVTVASTGAWRPGRPAGPRFGTLVHAVLAEIPFEADEALVSALTGAQGRLLGASAEELDAAAAAVRKALEHPLLRRAAQAVHCRREVPLCHRVADGTLVEGVADLAFEEVDPFGEGSRWTVVDFKTDLDASGATDSYVVQVEIYAAALQAATGTEVDGVLLAV